MTVTILRGDCREVLQELPADSVHCVVTSPPYFGLRDYGTAQWDGGDPGCDHSPEKRGGRFATPVSSKQASNTGSGTASQRECPCGAHRIDSQIGLEPTPDAFVAELVSVFREVRRVLRKDGTVWLNLGDSYNSNSDMTRNDVKAAAGLREQPRKQRGIVTGIKQKDLLGIPWRVAFALQTDGWYLRQDIIWSKPNPMPESVRDRCTKAHEYLFLLSKSERYYYDAEAIAEPIAISSAARYDYDFKDKRSGSTKGLRVSGECQPRGNNVPTRLLDEPTARNRRSVWEVTTQPFPEAHFATFPPALIEPCILAGCPEKVCAKCGAPWVREVEQTGGTTGKSWHDHSRDTVAGQSQSIDIRAASAGYKITDRGFFPSCSCNAGTVPGTCLDPFGGAGTTGLVADRLGRNAILIELNEAYAEMAKRRIEQDAGMFADVS